MELTPFLILPVVGGFWFSQTWSRIRYRSARESGHRLYFRAILVGALLLPIAALAHVFLFDRVAEYRSSALPFLADLLGQPWSGGLWEDTSRIAVFFLTILLGPLLGRILDLHRIAFLPDRFWPSFAIPLRTLLLNIEEGILDRALRNNDLERLMMRSALNLIPILVTLSGGKIYVGFAVRLPNPELERTDIRLLPLLSGYRDAETQAIHFTTNYDRVLRQLEHPNLSHLRPGDFEVVIPVSQISASHLFDVEAYEYFRQQDQETDVEFYDVRGRVLSTPEGEQAG
jgi:hypothetical protein